MAQRKQWIAVADAVVGGESAHENDEQEASEVFCAVCQDVLRNGAFPGDPMMPVAFKCDYGHLAHKECADQWFSGPTALNKKCPVCHRDPLKAERSERVRAAVVTYVHRSRHSVIRVGWWVRRLKILKQRIWDNQPRVRWWARVAVFLLVVWIVLSFIHWATTLTSRNYSNSNTSGFVLVQAPLANESLPDVLTLHKQAKRQRPQEEL